MKRNSRQSQNNKTKVSQLVSDFHDSCNVKERKETN